MKAIFYVKLDLKIYTNRCNWIFHHIIINNIIEGCKLFKTVHNYVLGGYKKQTALKKCRSSTRADIKKKITFLKKIQWTLNIENSDI